MDKGKYLEGNLKKLESLIDVDSEWIMALKRCKEHVLIRLKRRTLFGAHTEGRLGIDPVEYYVSYAYEAILDGQWEWKDGRTLAQQMIRIANSCISKEVEKFGTERIHQSLMTHDDIDERFYSEDLPPDEPTLIQEAVFSKKISIIEEAIQRDENLEMFWECIKEGMKREAIAVFMEKSPKQIDKLREKLVNKTKSFPHF